MATQNVTRWLREGMKNPSLGMLRFWVEETLCFEQGVCCRWFPEGFPEVSRGHFHCKIFLVSIRWLVQDFSSPRRLILVLSFWSSMVIAFHVSFINIMLTGVRNGVCGDSAFVKHVLTEGLWLHVCFTVSKTSKSETNFEGSLAVLFLVLFFSASVSFLCIYSSQH